jgi:vacuolar protein-sorting-associated protein 4
MEGVGNNNEGVFLLGATNLPWTLDSALRRRFQRKIYIPLPDQKARMQLCRIRAEKWNVNLSKVDYMALANLTDGFSGSDISNALQDAFDMPLKKIQSSRYYKKVKRCPTSICGHGNVLLTLNRLKRTVSICSRRVKRAMQVLWP